MVATTVVLAATPQAAAQTGPVVPIADLYIDPEYNSGIDPKSDLSAGGFIEIPTGVFVELYYDAVGADLSNAKGACAYLQVDSGDTIRVCYNPDDGKTYKITNEHGAVELDPICSASTAPEVFGTYSDPWDNTSLNTEGLAEWEDNAGGGTEYDTIIQCNVPWDLLQDDDDPAVINVCTLQANTPSAWNTSKAKDCALRSATEATVTLNAVVDGPDDLSSFTLSIVEPLSMQPLMTATPDAAGGTPEQTLFGGIYNLATTAPDDYTVEWSCEGATYGDDTLTLPAEAAATCTATFTYDSGVPPILPGDLDSDGVADEYDIDDDNDGIVDAVDGATSNFQWAAWSSISGSTATGSAAGVNFTYTSTSTITSTPSMYRHNYFPAQYNVPNTTTIRNDHANNNVLSFSAPVTDPLFAFSSVGSPSIPVAIVFSAPVEVLWATTEGTGSYWRQDSSTQITGAEGFFIVKMAGVYESVTMNYTAPESYANFAFGADFYVPFDTDGDGVVNPRDLDSDNDGITDFYESTLDPAIRALDTNGNGSLSLDEAIDSDGDGLMDVFEDDISERVGRTPPNFDEDSLANFLDLDSDGDSIPDATEWQSTADYRQNDGDLTDEDADGDGIVDLFDLGSWFGGPVGLPVDTDGDSHDDFLDTDSDNDLSPDQAEAGLVAAPTYVDTDGAISTASASLMNELGDTSEVAFREYTPAAWVASAATTVAETDLGETFGYTFTISATEGVPIVDLTAASSACQSPPVYDSGDTNTNTWLDSGETWTFVCTSTTVSADQADAGLVEASVMFTGTPHLGTIDPATATTSVPVPANPAIEVSATTITVPTAAGQVLDYTIALSNTGNVAVTDPGVTGDLCADTPVYASGDSDDDGELDAGETWTYQCVSTPITQDAVDSGVVTLAVGGSGTAVRGELADATATLAVPIAPMPGISVVKAAQGAPGAAGDTIVYSFTIVNTGNVSLFDLVFTDPSCATTPTLQSESGTADAIASPTETQVFTCTSVAVTQAEVDAGEVSSLVFVTATPANGTPPGASADLTVSVSADPGWELIKSALTSATFAGDSIDYSFSLVNTGNVTVHSVSIADPKCHAAPVMVSESITTDGLLQPGETQVWTCTSIAVTQLEVDQGAVVNNAQAHGLTPGGADPNTTTDSSTSHTSTISATPQWTLTTAPVGTPAHAGDDYAYTHALTNVGNVSIESITVTGSRCATAATLVSGDDGDAILQPGETWTLTCPATPPTTAEVDGGTLTHDAVAAGTATRGELADATASTTLEIVGTPELDLVISSDSTPSIPGDTVRYRYTVVNTGNVTIHDPVITDASCTAPPVLESETVAGDGHLTAGESQIWSCTTGPITVDHVAAGEITTSAQASGTPALGLLEPAIDDYSIPIGATPSWTLIAVDPDPDLSVGGTWTRVFTLTNTGNTSIGAIAVSDPHCATTPVIVDPDDHATPIEPVDLGFGQSQTWACQTVPLTQADLDAGVRTSAPSASGVSNGGELADATTTIDNTIAAQPGWQILKYTEGTATAAGDSVRYVFELVNTGNVTIDPNSVTDAKCATAPVLDSESAALDFVITPGETQLWSCDSIPITQAEADLGTAHNVASATGTPARGSLGEPVVATHDLHIVSDPRMTLLISTPSTIAAQGDVLELLFTVVNTGNVSISDLAVASGRCATPAVAVGEPVPTMAPGAATTFRCASIGATQAEVDLGFVDVAAVATAVSPGGAPDPATASLRVEATQAPSISLTIAPLSTPALGVELPYSLTLVNTGNVTVTDVVVDLDRCVSTPVATSASAADLTLSPGEVWTLTCDSPAVTQPEVDLGTIPANATAVGAAAGSAVNATATHDAAVAQNPAWDMIVWTDSVVSEPGDTIIYHYEVVNTGNVTIGLALVSDARCASGPVAIEAPAVLAAGDRMNLVCESLPIEMSHVEAGYVDNAAVLTGTWVAGLMPDVHRTVRVNIVAEPAMSATMAALNGVGMAGDQVVYEFTVVNTGNVTLTAVTVASASCADAPTPVLDGGPLGAGETRAYRCTSHPITQGQVDSGTLDAQAVASATPTVGTVDPVPLDLTIVINAVPSLSVVLAASVPEVPAVGGFTYSFTVVNDGNVTLYDPTLAPSHCDGSATLTYESSGNDGVLAVGETQVWTCVALAPTLDQANLGQIDAEVLASAASIGGVGASDHDTATVLVPLAASWALSISTDSTPELGQPLVYRIELSNEGNVSVSAVNVTGTNCVGEPTPLGGDVNENSTLDPGETWMYECDSPAVTQDQVDAGSITGAAEATGEPARSELDSLHDEVTTSIEAVPGLAATKATTTTPGGAGEVLEYSFLVVNTGNVSLTDVSIDDPSCQTAPTLVPPSPDPIAPGHSQTWTCSSVPTTQLDVEAGQVESAGEVSAVAVSGSHQSALVDLVVPIAAAPAIDLIAVADGPPTRAGGVIDYSLTVVNTGNVILHPVAVAAAHCATEPVLVSSSIESPGEHDDQLWPGEVWHLTCTSTELTQHDFDTGSVTGPFSVTGLAGSSGNSAQADATVETLLAEAPALAISASRGPAVAYPSTRVSFDVTVTNAGNVTLLTVALVPEPLRQAECTSATTIVADSLAPGEGVDLVCTVTVAEADVIAGELRHALLSTAVSPAGTPVSADTEVVFPVELPDEDPRIGTALDVEVFPRNDGSVDIEFRIVVENLGNVALSDLAVKQDLAVVFGAESFDLGSLFARVRGSESIVGAGLASAALEASACAPNAAYDGITDTSLVVADGHLVPGGACLIELVVTVVPEEPKTYDAQVDASGVSPAGAVTTDLSVAGELTDPSGDGVPDEADPSVFVVEVPDRPLLVFSNDPGSSQGDGSSSGSDSDPDSAEADDTRPADPDGSAELHSSDESVENGDDSMPPSVLAYTGRTGAPLVELGMVLVLLGVLALYGSAVAGANTSATARGSRRRSVD